MASVRDRMSTRTQTHAPRHKQTKNSHRKKDGVGNKTNERQTNSVWYVFAFRLHGIIYPSILTRGKKNYMYIHYTRRCERAIINCVFDEWKREKSQLFHFRCRQRSKFSLHFNNNSNLNHSIAHIRAVYCRVVIDVIFVLAHFRTDVRRVLCSTKNARRNFNSDLWRARISSFRWRLSCRLTSRGNFFFFFGLFYPFAWFIAIWNRRFNIRHDDDDDNGIDAAAGHSL